MWLSMFSFWNYFFDLFSMWRVLSWAYNLSLYIWNIYIYLYIWILWKKCLKNTKGGFKQKLSWYRWKVTVIHVIFPAKTEKLIEWIMFSVSGRLCYQICSVLSYIDLYLCLAKILLFKCCFFTKIHRVFDTEIPPTPLNKRLLNVQ